MFTTTHVEHPVWEFFASLAVDIARLLKFLTSHNSSIFSSSSWGHHFWDSANEKCHPTCTKKQLESNYMKSSFWIWRRHIAKGQQNNPLPCQNQGSWPRFLQQHWREMKISDARSPGFSDISVDHQLNSQKLRCLTKTNLGRLRL